MKNEDVARRILGDDFITPEEIMSARPVIKYTDAQMEGFEKTLPRPDELEYLRDKGIILLPGPGTEMSLLDIRALNEEFFYCKKGGWYSKESFSHDDKVGTEWLKFPKKPILDSIGKGWDEMRRQLPETEYVPNVAELAWVDTSSKAVRGTYLLSGVIIWTSSLDSCNNLRVYLGHPSEKGISINSYGGVHKSIGWIFARK